MQIHLRVKLAAREQKRQRVVTGFTDEFARTRVDETLERVDDIRSPLQHLIERSPRDRVGAAEALVVTLHKVKHLERCGAIALVGHLAHDPLVRFVVKVKRIARKHRVTAQSIGLVKLEVEADARH